MLESLVLLSDARAALDARSRNFFRLDPTDAFVVLGVLVVLAALLFFWALYVRKRPREKFGAPAISSREHTGNGDFSGRRRMRVRRKRRRHHPDNFPRNPTLGETGGLPPLRPEEEPVPPETGGEPPSTKA